MFLPSTGLKTKDVERDNNSFRQITEWAVWLRIGALCEHVVLR